MQRFSAWQADLAETVLSVRQRIRSRTFGGQALQIEEEEVTGW